MVNAYRSTKPLADQELWPGVKIRNNTVFVTEGREETFRSVAWVQRMLERGELILIESRELEEEPVHDQELSQARSKPSLSYQAAYSIAEKEFHINRDKLKELIRSGRIPGKNGSTLSISELEFREVLDGLMEELATEEATASPEENDEG